MLIKKNRIPIKQIILMGFFPSFFKILIYKFMGYKIGKNVSIGLGSVLIGKNVLIGDNTKIGFLTIIRAEKIRIDRFVKIGSFVFMDTESIEIGDDTRINEQVIIAGIKTPESMFKIGKRAIIMEYSFLNPTKPLVIGDDTGIGGHCLLFTHGSWLSQLDGFPVTFAPITLGNNVWLPWRVFIMPGVNVGNNVVIGANSLVNKSLPANCLAAGSPAKIISESYPPEISFDERNRIFESIINDFIDYIRHNGFESSREVTNEITSKIIVQKDNNNHIIMFSSNGNVATSDFNDNLLVLDDSSLDTEKYLDRYGSVVNLQKKERIGSSKIGEEFLSFLSRYGIRFNRLD